MISLKLPKIRNGESRPPTLVWYRWPHDQVASGRRSRVWKWMKHTGSGWCLDEELLWCLISGVSRRVWGDWSRPWRRECWRRGWRHSDIRVWWVRVCWGRMGVDMDAFDALMVALWTVDQNVVRSVDMLSERLERGIYSRWRSTTGCRRS